MAYTVEQLISNAYYISGVVSREFQTVSGPQHEDGLMMLNDILGDKTVETDMIPYYTIDYEFPANVGQQTYFIPDLITVETLVFFIDTVRYSITPVPMDPYFGSSRSNDINSLPLTYTVQRCFGGANIYLYYYPNQEYLMQLTGFFRMNQVVQGQDLSLTLDRFYINYLKYALAKRICTEFNYSVPPGAQEQLEIYQNEISKRSAPLQLNVQTLNLLSDKNAAPNYGQTNLGRGWTTS